MILVINRRRKDAVAVSEILYYMGILSRACTPVEALNEISTKYKAVVIMDPEKLPDAVDYLKRLKSYASVPTFAVSDKISHYEYKDIFDGVFNFSILSTTLIRGINEYCKIRELPLVGDYRVAGINANADQRAVRFFNDTIKLTRTETMVLRFLIRSYPLPVDANDILHYAFKISKLPERASIRTHICVINKKFIKLSGRKLVSLVSAKGYVLDTPETRKMYSL